MTAVQPIAREHGAYRALLEAKFRFVTAQGFEVAPADVHPQLLPHQRDIVLWALRLGRAALFCSFGLGKTIMQLELARQVRRREGGRQLTVAPLGVRQEFRRDAAMLGIEVTFVRSTEEIGGDGLYLTNYESVRAGKLDVSLFDFVSLDEAAVLRDYGSETFQEFLPLFADVRYRFVATATPSPNRYKELIHYAGFLGVMDTGRALTRFFQRNSERANDLTLYPHMEREFHLWLHSWAVFLRRPSELGHADDGYELPPLRVHWHEVPAASLAGRFESNGQGQLIADAALGLKDAADAKRGSIDAHAFWRSSGDRLPTPDELAQLGPKKLAALFPELTREAVYDYGHHVAVGEKLEHAKRLPSTFMAIAPGSHHPDVWHDVNRMRTLNGEQTQRGLVNHICPLQFDIVDRLIERYSNPGDLVFDPFGGLMTVPVRAMKLGRRGRAVELNEDYFRDGLRYCRETERDMSTPSLFDLVGDDASPAPEIGEAAE